MTGMATTVKENEEKTVADLDKVLVEALEKALRDSQVHRDVLRDIIEDLIGKVRHEAVTALEQATTGNPELFRILRKRILDTAGSQVRQLPAILNDFTMCQVYERTTVTNVIAKSDGPWRLPLGVKMPNERPQAK